MDDSIKVSVIVPVYNVEQYVEECISSLLEQTMNSVEIVIVNDGSTDSSYEKVLKYKSRQNVVIINKENEGVALARKDGVERAKGEYICFVDSDDYVSKDFCRELYDSIVANGADVAECSYYYLSNGCKPVCIYSQNKVLVNEEFVEGIYTNLIVAGNGAALVWNKIYKKSKIIETVLDYGVSVLEDYLFNMQYMSVVEKYNYLNKPLYYYRVREGSLSKAYSSERYRELCRIKTIKDRYMLQLNLNSEECMQANAKWFISYVFAIIRVLAVGVIPATSSTGMILKEIMKDATLSEICKHSKHYRTLCFLVLRRRYVLVTGLMRVYMACYKWKRLSIQATKILLRPSQKVFK